MLMEEVLYKDEKIEIKTKCNYAGNVGYLVLSDRRILFEIRYSDSYSKIFHLSDYYNIKFINIAEATIGKSIVISTKYGEYEFKVSNIPEIEEIIDIVEDRKGKKKYNSEPNIRNMNYLNIKNRERASIGMILMYIGISIIVLSASCWFLSSLFEGFK